MLSEVLKVWWNPRRARKHPGRGLTLPVWTIAHSNEHL